MTSQRVHEGYLHIDHRASPGITPEFIRASGKPGGVAVGEGTHYESATSTCAHCNAVVILNPDRSRPRNYCRRCDRYICDGCAAIPTDGICTPFEALLIRQQNIAYHQVEVRGEIIDLRRVLP